MGKLHLPLFRLIVCMSIALAAQMAARLPAQAQVVEATQLVLKDSIGSVRARLHVDGSQEVRLEFYDTKAARRAVVAVSPGGGARMDFLKENGDTVISLDAGVLGPFLHLFGADASAWIGAGNNFALLGLTAGHGETWARTALRAHNESGTSGRSGSELSFSEGSRERIQLGWGLGDSMLSIYGATSAKGAAEVLVPDNGSPRVAVKKRAFSSEKQPSQESFAAIGLLSTDGGDAPGFAVVDRQGKVRGGLALKNDEMPILTLQSPTGGTSERVLVTIDQYGRPLLRLSDPTGATRFALGIGEDTDGTPYITFFDKHGKSIPPSSPVAHHWVLWRQGFLSSSTLGSPLQQVTLALGAWPTRDECEAHRDKGPAASGPPRVDTCLPDTVNLRDRR
jgi:hypothetical protein